MTFAEAIGTTRRLSFADRLELRLSTGRSMDGIWIGTIESDAEPFLQRVEAALALIRLHDPIRYQRLRRDLSRIWIRLLPGARANFNASARACQLDSRYVRDDAVSVTDLATTIVHEAAHARLDRWITYHEDLRHRIEAACRRQELAFARRLPAGEAIQERIRAWLATPPSKEFWSDSELKQEFVNGSLEALRHLRVPHVLLRVVLGLYRASSAARRFASGLTRRWSGRRS